MPVAHGGGAGAPPPRNGIEADEGVRAPNGKSSGPALPGTAAGWKPAPRGCLGQDGTRVRHDCVSLGGDVTRVGTSRFPQFPGGRVLPAQAGLEELRAHAQDLVARHYPRVDSDGIEDEVEGKGGPEAAALPGQPAGEQTEDEPPESVAVEPSLG